MSEIYLLKLVNGETLLGEMVSKNDWVVKMNNPIAFTIQMREAPVMVSSMWVPLPDEQNEFEIRQEHIITIKKVDIDLILYYNKCMETIIEATSEDESFLMGGSDPEDYDETIEYAYSANTSIH